jgi:hypothetical protein
MTHQQVHAAQCKDGKVGTTPAGLILNEMQAYAYVLTKANEFGLAPSQLDAIWSEFKRLKSAYRTARAELVASGRTGLPEEPQIPYDVPPGF